MAGIKNKMDREVRRQILERAQALKLQMVRVSKSKKGKKQVLLGGDEHYLSVVWCSSSSRSVIKTSTV